MQKNSFNLIPQLSTSRYNSPSSPSLLSTSGSFTSETIWEREPFPPEERQRRAERQSPGFCGKTVAVTDGDRPMMTAFDQTDHGGLLQTDHGGSALFLSTETRLGARPRWTNDEHRRLQLTRLLRREDVDALEADVLEQVYDEYFDGERKVTSSSRDARLLKHGVELEEEFDTVL